MSYLNFGVHVFCPEGVLSDSEEDRGPEAVAQQNTTCVWSSKCKQSTEQGGYSSEASTERGEGTGSTDNLLMFCIILTRWSYRYVPTKTAETHKNIQDWFISES